MKILLLAGKGTSTLYLYNGLKNKYNISNVIIEDSVSKSQLLKNRIRKIGLTKVVGQLIFIMLIPKLLKYCSQNRIQEIENDYFLSKQKIPKNKINFLPSVNDEKCINLIKQYKPDIILVNGTRIISSEVLNCTNSPFINIHVGITPSYRGVHGAYWSLANRDKENCGVTIHYVDKGIDTGKVIAQSKIKITRNDNFVTYPIHQYGIGIELIRETLQSLKNGDDISIHPVSNKSNLYYHPTIFEYLKFRIMYNVK